jgi:N-acyl amino acid synthase of PEP-CTERM/exosortase system
MGTAMYYLNSGVAQIRSAIRTLAATTPLASTTTEQRTPLVFEELKYYNSIFESSVAEHAAQRLDCYRIRYQVYCIDNTYEDPDNSPDRLETDAFDSHSIHSLLTHRSTGNAIGTVRVVLPRASGERRRFPLHQVAGAVVGDDVAPFPIERTGEISRFSTVKSFRQHIPDRGVETLLTPDAWRKMIFHLPLGLIRSCIEMSVQEGLTHLAALMEPALLRLLTRLGIHFNALGPLVDYHGQRQPCWVDLDVMLRRVYRERPDVWDVMTDGGRLWPLTEARPVAP